MTEHDNVNRFSSRRHLLGLLGGLGVSAIGSATGASAATDRSEDTRRLQVDDCPIPLFTDEYIGFSVGQPEGWGVEYSGGIVWLAPADATDPVLTFVYPGWLQEGVTVDDVVEGFVAGLNDSLAADGDALEWVPDGGTLAGTLGGVAVEGELWTAQSDQYGRLSGGLAPTDEWGTVAETVETIVACFELQPTVPLVVTTVSGSDPLGGSATWECAAPDDWVITPIGTMLEIAGEPDDAGQPDARISFFGTPIQSIFYDPDATHDQYLEAYVQAFQAVGLDFQVLERWDSRPFGGFTDNLGFEWELMETTLRTTLNGKEYISVVVTGLTRGEGYTGAQLWHRDMAAHRWQELAAITEVVQWSIRILDVQAGGSGYSPPVGNSTVTDVVADTTVSDIIVDMGRARDAVDDHIHQEFSGTMLGNDRVEVPDYPGVEFIAPSNNYDPAACLPGQRPVPDPWAGGYVCGNYVEGP